MADERHGREATLRGDLVLRPNGLVERMDRAFRPAVPGYASERAGRSTREHLQIAARSDRRRRRRPVVDPFKGRLYDLSV